MCFMPFIGTKSTPALVPRFPCQPGTALNPLHPEYEFVRGTFTLPHGAELQLMKGCGCCLRYVDQPTSEDMDWVAKLNVSDPKYDPSNDLGNHDALADYLQKHFSQDEFVEFLGLWDVDKERPLRGEREIPLNAIRHPHFHFHTATLYRLLMLYTPSWG